MTPISESLSERLKFILALTDPDIPLWDIGCDHGLIGLQALRDSSGKKLVAFVDPSLNVISGIKQKLVKMGSEPSCLTFCNKGEDLDWSAVDGNIIIAGMGWRNIQGIFNEGQKTPRNRVWILNPFSEEKRAESFLSEWAEANKAQFQSYCIEENSRRRWVFRLVQVVSCGDIKNQ